MWQGVWVSLILLAVVASQARAGHVQLRVTDRFGRSINDVSACANTDPCVTLPSRASAGVTIVETMGPARLTLTARGFLPARIATPVAGGSHDIRLIAKGSLDVTARADAIGSRVGRPHATLYLLDEGPTPTRVDSRALDVGGLSTTFSDIPDGRYRVTLTGESIAEVETDCVIAQDRPIPTVVLPLRSLATPLGLAIEANGSAVADARLTIVLPPLSNPAVVSAVADSRGQFRNLRLPSGASVAWSASAQGYLNASGYWSGEAQLIAILDRAPAIEGTVLPRPERPDDRSNISIEYRESSSTASTEHAYSDLDGRFRVFPRRREAVTLVIHRYGYRTSTLAVGTLTADTDLGEITLDKGRTIAGSVRSRRSGEAIAGANVAATFDTTDLFRPGDYRVTTGEDGRFRVAGLPTDEDVTLAAEARSFGRGVVRAVPGLDEVKIELAVGGVLKGEACGSGEERAAMEIAIRGGDGFTVPQTTRVDASAGSFKVEDLAPGRYFISRRWLVPQRLSPGSVSVALVPEAIPVLIEEGGTSQLSIGCGVYVVRGKAAASGAWAGSPVWFTAEGGSVGSGLVDAGGWFSVRVPDRGSYVGRSAQGVREAPCVVNDPVTLCDIDR